MEPTASQQTQQSTNLAPRPPITEVQAEAIGQEPPVVPVIPPDRRISWLGWLTAILIFIANKKLGLVLFVVLLIFRQFPTLNLRQLPRAAGSLLRKFRS